ncbi:MAG: ATP-binding cassette domain-containing protein [Candidatus Hinthialibacter antarcticus]|nr:ATP-binding cassette domain-containing protein [Candidatus Hinthialibacter antarcticus]
MICLTNVCKSFSEDGEFVVRDLCLEIHKGETLVLLGSSGCGKTTTLKMINGLVLPSSGLIEVDGRDIKTVDPVALRRSMGYVFQGIGLFPHLTVEDNVSIVLRLQGRSAFERKDKAFEWLGIVGLDPEQYAKRYPNELSGGQKQRVGVARALAADPDYLLMDEPFGALDAITRDDLQQELMKIRLRMAKTIVFVTHDLFEALTLADRIAVMNHGRIDQIGVPNELMQSPATEFVRELFEKPKRQLQLVQGNE